jgi:rubrerythrin
MNRRFFRYSYLLLALTATIGLLTCPARVAARAPQTSQTLRNLLTARSGEHNANLRYLAFAQRADDEGYREVATLFRAAARAEEIHLMNHAAVIRAMGESLTGILEFPVVKSTRKNLLTAANRGEAFERDVMYPGFIKQADAEGNGEAARTFDLARKAEAQHFSLFADALVNLNNRREVSHAYYVCTVCGYTVSERAVDRCISCAREAEKYEEVS